MNQSLETNQCHINTVVCSSQMKQTAFFSSPEMHNINAHSQKKHLPRMLLGVLTWHD